METQFQEISIECNKLMRETSIIKANIANGSNCNTSNNGNGSNTNIKLMNNITTINNNSK
jgi:hypothetical protein